MHGGPVVSYQVLVPFCRKHGGPVVSYRVLVPFYRMHGGPVVSYATYLFRSLLEHMVDPMALLIVNWKSCVITF